MGEARICTELLSPKPKGKRLLWTPRLSVEDQTKMDVKDHIV
jgi:hypothetical protein